MGDDLEKFIVRNRSEFDSEIPGDKVWTGIHKGLKNKRSYEIWWKVAAVIFLASTIFLIVDRNMDQPLGEDGVGMELSEFNQAEDFYIKLIAEKKAEIAKFDRGQLKREFLLEIDRLDQMYAELKRTYKRQNSTDLLVDAMISNLKLRIDILNHQIKILEKLNQTQNESDPTFEI